MGGILEDGGLWVIINYQQFTMTIVLPRERVLLVESVEMGTLPSHLTISSLRIASGRRWGFRYCRRLSGEKEGQSVSCGIAERWDKLESLVSRRSLYVFTL